MDNRSSHQLHGFCDASESAYGAVVYLRSKTDTGTITVHLACAKTRVSPVKQVSIPRLELCSAVLLSKLIKKAQCVLKVEQSNIHAWTDSTITLAWIQGHPRRWKTFIANRVSTIQDLVPPIHWRHVSSKENPADAASRGMLPQELVILTLWWTGPQWLAESRDHWPKYGTNKELDEKLLEERSVKTFITTVSPQWDLVNKFSNLTTLKRVTAYCLRFVNNCKKVKESRSIGNLSSLEMYDAFMVCVKYVQGQEFAKQISCISQGLPIASHLLPLNPFLDDVGILRVGGRIRNARVQYDQRFPILLPRNHPFTERVIVHIHVSQLHADPQATLATIQQMFWIINGRKVIRRILHKCHKCFKDRTVMLQQQMGDLPLHRLVPSRPFLRCGVDFGGPFHLKSSKIRNAKILKVYLALFVCFATKAVHLELQTDLTQAAFIATLQRFMARRGKCSDIYSDNGTTFVGTNRELKELFRQFKSQQHNEKISTFLNSEGTNWHFIPAKSPHFGGLWEAGIKSAKTHLRRVIGNTPMTFEELYTVITQIEACLNSRPLCPLSSNPTDLAVLTPGHFLIGEALTSVPHPSITHLKSNHLSRWQLTQQLTQHFWKRWQREYLCQLQQRPKWKTKKENIKIGDLVLIKEDNMSPCQWLRGRVVDTFPGSDNLIRVVNVKTHNGIYKRPIIKLCLLPM